MTGTSIALIVAAGRGARAGGGTPKQYQDLAGRAVLAWTIDAFLTHPRLDGVRVIIHADDAALYEQVAADVLARRPQHAGKLLSPALGGPSRQSSVRSGLESLTSAAPGHVLIHDAARPFVSADIIDRVLDGLHAHGTTQSGVIAALPIADTLKRQLTHHGDGSAGDAMIGETLSREGIWRAQTPQGFPFAQILDAHRVAAQMSVTDDASVFEAVGRPVVLVLGAPDNMKITMAEDFGLAETLLLRGPREQDGSGGQTGAGEHHGTSGAYETGMMEYRTGQGFDVHAFMEGDHVILCGVKVPHDRALKGHSDADVGLHVVTDAIYGALGDGDIGAHFPPSEPQWRGAASEVFLAHARDRVVARGGRLVHVDVTLICERPKVGPHREAMRAEVARILGIDVSRVSVKATTTEMLGFTGRGEGIAALATATIALPEGLPGDA